MKYSDKLKDPRWQKLRLQIFERDEFACQRCGDDKSTLHVHHLRYIPGKEPWEYPIGVCLTLCEECHTFEYENMSNSISGLIEQIKDKQFLSSDVDMLACAFNNLQSNYPPDVTSCIIDHALGNAEIFSFIATLYFKTIEKYKGEENG
jgi:hypothetical protein